jgi:hypothetical protein
MNAAIMRPTAPARSETASEGVAALAISPPKLAGGRANRCPPQADWRRRKRRESVAEREATLSLARRGGLPSNATTRAPLSENMLFGSVHLVQVLISRDIVAP